MFTARKLQVKNAFALYKIFAIFFSILELFESILRKPRHGQFNIALNQASYICNANIVF